MKQNILLSILLGVILIGCKEEVTCSSPETQSLFYNSYMQEIKNARSSSLAPLIESNFKISLTNVQTISSDKTSGTQSCKAELLVDTGTPAAGSLFELLKSNKISVDKAVARLMSNNYLWDLSPQDNIGIFSPAIAVALASPIYSVMFKNVVFNKDGYSTNVYYDISLNKDNNTQTVNIKDLDILVMPNFLIESMNFAKSTTTVQGKITLEESDEHRDVTHYPGYFLHLPTGNVEDKYFLGIWDEKETNKINVLIKKSGCKIYSSTEIISGNFSGFNNADCSIEAIGNESDSSIPTLNIISMMSLNSKINPRESSISNIVNTTSNNKVIKTSFGVVNVVEDTVGQDLFFNKKKINLSNKDDDYFGEKNIDYQIHRNNDDVLVVSNYGGTMDNGNKFLCKFITISGKNSYKVSERTYCPDKITYNQDSQLITYYYHNNVGYSDESDIGILTFDGNNIKEIQKVRSEKFYKKKFAKYTPQQMYNFFQKIQGDSDVEGLINKVVSNGGWSNAEQYGTMYCIPFNWMVKPPHDYYYNLIKPACSKPIY